MIWRAQDALTRAGFVIGSAALGGIVVAYLIEVIARYMFNSPTMWSASAVAYLLCVAVMLAMPELARTRGHIAITILEERLPPGLQPHHIRLTAALAGIVCVVAAWMIWNESIRQWQSGITTTRGIRIPKYWISAFICYGFTNTAVYYLRGAAMPATLPWKSASAEGED